MINREEEIKKTVANFQKVAAAFPEFRYLGDPILRTKTQEATLKEGIEAGKILGAGLVKFRRLVGYGRGLAAPQLGIDKAVFVTFLNDEVQTYINPRITRFAETFNYYRELCLSSGIIWGDIKRSVSITMEWTDVKGKRQTKDVDGFLARLWQHEGRHLEGEINVDIAIPGSLEIVTSDPLLETLRDYPLRK